MENAGFMVKLLTSKDMVFYGQPKSGKSILANFIKTNSKYDVNYVDIMDQGYFDEFIVSEDYKKNKGVTIFITNTLDTAVHISSYFSFHGEIKAISKVEKLPF